MRLITHSAGQGNLGQGCFGVSHQFLPEHNSPFRDVPHGRLPKAVAEGAKEVRLAQAYDTSEIDRSNA
jgi:hypothetical protein